MSALLRSVQAACFWGLIWLLIFAAVVALSVPIGLGILLFLATVAGAVS